MSLMRLTHERYASMRAAGEFPEDTPVDPIAPPPPDQPPPSRGGVPQHPTWPRVMALVRNLDGSAVDWDYVAEAPRISDAILIASRYPYRAIVTTKSGKREFDNRKVLEVGTV